MADEGTFIGEVQRGWQRFWRLSWWWKAPILGVTGLIAIGAVGSIAGGGDDKPKEEAAAVRSTATATRTATARPSRATASPKPATVTPTPTAEPTSEPTQTPLTTYPMVDVNSFSEGTAERAFAEWLTAWKDKDFDRMFAFSEKDWQQSGGSPEELDAQYGSVELLGAEFTNIVRTSEVANDITATIYRLDFFGSDVLKKQITARIFRETGTGELSPTGEWGVNPVSTLREKDVP